MLFPIFTFFILRHQVVCIHTGQEKNCDVRTIHLKHMMLKKIEWVQGWEETHGNDLDLAYILESKCGCAQSRQANPHRSTEAWMRIRDCYLKPQNFGWFGVMRKWLINRWRKDYKGIKINSSAWASNADYFHVADLCLHVETDIDTELVKCTQVWGRGKRKSNFLKPHFK